MTTRLQKGANISLSAAMPTLGTVVAGFGWRVIQGNGPETELVPAALVVDSNDKAISPDHLVFFNQLEAVDGAVSVTGDDAEQIEVDLAAIPDAVAKIILLVYVNPDLRRPGSFSAVKDAYVHLLDRAGSEIVRYDLEPGSVDDTSAAVFGELYRHNGSWKFRAIGAGYKDGVQGVARTYGLPL